MQIFWTPACHNCFFSRTLSHKVWLQAALNSLFWSCRVVLVIISSAHQDLAGRCLGFSFMPQELSQCKKTRVPQGPSGSLTLSQGPWPHAVCCLTLEINYYMYSFLFSRGLGREICCYSFEARSTIFTFLLKSVFFNEINKPH